MPDRHPDSTLLDAAMAQLRAHDLTVRQDGDKVTVTHGPTPRTFRAVTRRAIRPATLGALVDGVASGSPPALIVTDHLSAATAALLRQRGLAYADASGNAWVCAEGLFVFVDGRRASTLPPPPKQTALPPSVLQVLFAILRSPTAAGLPLRTLGELAGVSHVAARQALAAATARGWVTRLGRRDHTVVDLDGMLAAWVEAFPSRLGPSLELGRVAYVGADDPRAWARAVTTRQGWGDDLVGGELGAWLAGVDAHGPTGAVYVDALTPQLFKRLRIAPSREGTLIARRRFTAGLGSPELPHVADPLLVLGDVSAIPDERLDGARAELRRRVSDRWSRG